MFRGTLQRASANLDHRSKHVRIDSYDHLHLPMSRVPVPGKLRSYFHNRAKPRCFWCDGPKRGNGKGRQQRERADDVTFADSDHLQELLCCPPFLFFTLPRKARLHPVCKRWRKEGESGEQCGQAGALERAAGRCTKGLCRS